MLYRFLKKFAAAAVSLCCASVCGLNVLAADTTLDSGTDSSHEPKSQSSSAADAEEQNRFLENITRKGNWAYTVTDEENKTAALSAYYGNKTDVKIPKKIGGYTITAISGGWYEEDEKPVLYGNVHSIVYGDEGDSGEEMGTALVESSEVYSPFSDNKKVESVTIPETVTQVGAIAFKDCKKLKTVTFEGDARLIGNNCFDGCTALEEIELPESVKFIDRSAFTGCTALKKITLPNARMDGAVFDGCTGLEEAAFDDDVTEISGYCFIGCTSLKNVTFPEKLETIRNNAFQDCTALEEITFPKSLINVCNSAFSGCKNLKTVHGGESVEMIANKAFADCPITELNLSEKAVTFGEDAFGKTSDGKVIKEFTLIAPEFSAAYDYAKQNNIEIKPILKLTTPGGTEVTPENAEEFGQKLDILIIVVSGVAIVVLIALIIVAVRAKKGK